MISPTKQQQAILAFLEAHLKTFGRPPTRKEIARAFNFSSANAAQCHLRAMEEKGMLRLTPKLARGIRIGTTVQTEAPPSGAS